MRCEPGKGLKPVAELIGEGRSADGAGEDSNQRDPDLDRRKEPARVVDQDERLAGAAVAMACHVLKPAPARGDDGKLRHRQQAVYGDQEEHEEYLKIQHGHPIGAMVGSS